MSADDTSDEKGDPVEPDASTPDETADSGADVRDRLEQEADRAVEQFDESIIDLLSWILETETRARIYIHLRQNPESTSDEIASGTGLYPSTVREALAELHEEGTVSRSKRQNDGAGNNPYEYSAIPPSDLVAEMVDDVQSQLNKVFNLDRYLERTEDEADVEPVTITVTEEPDLEGREDGARENGASDGDVAGEKRDSSGDTTDGERDSNGDATGSEETTGSDDGT